MGENRRLLLISYYFPPSGMGGVQRALKLAKYLPRLGWEVTILTVKDIAYYHKDESLLSELDSVDIQRTGSLDPLRIAHLASIFFKNKPESSINVHLSRTKLFRNSERYLFVPDAKTLWIPFAFSRGCRIVKKRNIDAILSTAPPFSLHISACLLARRFKLPWIADFRDGWTNNDFLVPATRIHHILNRLLEKASVRCADRVTGVSQKIVEYLRAVEPEKKDKFSLIYNGFDAEDFGSVPEDSEKFIISFVGTVTPWSDPSVFFPAISRACESNPGLRKSVVVQIVGKIMHPTFLERLFAVFDRDNVIIAGYRPHADAVSLMLKSRLLLLPITKYDTTGILPGKMYEYLASGIPIMAHVPSGEAQDILSRFGENVFFQHESSVEESARKISSCFTRWKQNGRKVARKATGEIPDEPLRMFSRKYHAKQFAELLDEITVKKPGR